MSLIPDFPQRAENQMVILEWLEKGNLQRQISISMHMIGSENMNTRVCDSVDAEVGG